MNNESSRPKSFKLQIARIFVTLIFIIGIFAPGGLSTEPTIGKDIVRIMQGDFTNTESIYVLWLLALILYLILNSSAAIAGRISRHTFLRSVRLLVLVFVLYASLAGLLFFVIRYLYSHLLLWGNVIIFISTVVAMIIEVKQPIDQNKQTSQQE